MSPRWRPTTAALPEHDQAISGMTELIAASERYAGWLKIGKEPDGTPSRTDVEREFAGGRIPIRFTALAPSGPAQEAVDWLVDQGFRMI